MEPTAEPAKIDWLIPLTDAEHIELFIRVGAFPAEPVGGGGLALHVTGDGTARDALLALSDIRGTDEIALIGGMT